MAVRRRTRRGADGAAAVEFALVSAFVLLPLLIGIIQYSLVFWSVQVAAHAAEQGARAYAVDPCEPGTNNDFVRGVVQGSYASNVATRDTISVSASFSGAVPPETGDDVTVRVSFPTIDIAGGFLPMPDTMAKSATSRVEDVEDC